MTRPSDTLDILMITYNRADYTRMSLARLLESCGEGMRVWVWHNGQDAETLEVVRGFASHPRFHTLHISPKNERLRGPTNWFWAQSDAAYVSKVDDDCLLPDGWAQTLLSAHRDNPDLGVIGCWRFYEEDFVPDLARRKIKKLQGGHELLRNCWVQGSGYVMRRDCQEALGPLGPAESFTGYCVRVALSGWQNGWYYPFIHEEHMDDPRSPYCLIRTDEQFMAQRPLSAIQDNVTTVAEWASRVRYMAKVVQHASPDPRNYVGWRRKARSIPVRLGRLLGVREEWRLPARARVES
jgi:glycosyltransferase involved in cell wall biosynthesis